MPLPFLELSATQSFTDRVLNFCYNHGIQSLLVGQPIDHIAVKLANRAAYNDYLQFLHEHGLCEGLTYTTMPGENRDLATAVLKKPIELVATDGTVLGVTRWLEVMEPRPKKADGGDIVGLEHIEVLVADYEAVKAELTAKNVPMEEGRNDYHCTVVVRWPAPDGVDGHWEEIKFTEKALSQIIAEEKADGHVVVLV